MSRDRQLQYCSAFVIAATERMEGVHLWKPRANPFGKIDGPLENFGNSALSENLMDSFYSEFEDRF